MKTAVMRSMELDDEDKLDVAQPIPMPDKPDYPYGLRITLSEKEMRKLDLDPAAAVVGGMVHGHFIARVTDVTISDNDDRGECCRVEMQIEDLAIESEEEENEESERGR